MKINLEHKSIFEEQKHSEIKTAEHVDYETPEKSFSDISDKDKYTQGIEVCSAAVLSGVDKLSGKRISFMTHSLPTNMVTLSGEVDFDEQYWKLLRKKVSDFTSKVTPETISLNLIGGNTGITRNIRETKGSFANIDATFRLARGIRSEIFKTFGKDADIFKKTFILGLPNSRNGMTNLLYINSQNKFLIFKYSARNGEILEPLTLSQYLRKLKELYK